MIRLLNVARPSASCLMMPAASSSPAYMAIFCWFISRAYPGSLVDCFSEGCEKFETQPGLVCNAEEIKAFYSALARSIEYDAKEYEDTQGKIYSSNHRGYSLNGRFLTKELWSSKL